MIKIYCKKILKEPLVLQVDDKSNFRGVLKTYFSQLFKIHAHEPARHRSQALVECRNIKIIFRFQQIEELHTGNKNNEWISYLCKIIDAINKHYEETPEVIDSMHNLPRADGDSKYVYPVGTKVRRQLDNSIGMDKEKLFGKFRATDYKIDEIKIYQLLHLYI